MDLEHDPQRAATLCCEAQARLVHRVVGMTVDVRSPSLHRLREVEMHHVDLGLGYTLLDWPQEYLAWDLPVLLASVPDRLVARRIVGSSWPGSPGEASSRCCPPSMPGDRSAVVGDARTPPDPAAPRGAHVPRCDRRGAAGRRTSGDRGGRDAGRYSRQRSEPHRCGCGRGHSRPHLHRGGPGVPLVTGCCGAHCPRMGFAIAVLGLVAAVWLALSVLTAAGARRRGQGPRAAGASGVVFPLTWVVWYANDYRVSRGPGRTGQPSTQNDPGHRDRTSSDPPG